jgi:hypothetical protein
MVAVFVDAKIGAHEQFGAQYQVGALGRRLPDQAFGAIHIALQVPIAGRHLDCRYRDEAGFHLHDLHLLGFTPAPHIAAR